MPEFTSQSTLLHIGTHSNPIPTIPIAFTLTNLNSTHPQHVHLQGLLGVRNRPDPLLNWDQLYNLKNQGALRRDCRALIADLPGGCRQPAHEIESLLTLYCKRRRMEYEPGNGWLDIMAVLLKLPFDLSTLYNCFYAITTKYIPR